VYTQGDITVENTYDGQGRRVRKLVKDLGAVTQDLRYMYDGWNLLYEVDMHQVSEPTRRYVWGLDISQSMQGAGGVGGLLFTESDSVRHAVTYDANGNISEYIDLSDGSIAAHLEYDAFGRTIVSTGSAPATYGFSTKYQEAESGYYYYGFRYYDAETGRWLNRDPIEERGGLNIYGFVANDGVGTWDRYGLAFGFVPPEFIVAPIKDGIENIVLPEVRGKAGPNVTRALKRTLANYQSKFWQLPSDEVRYDFCRRLLFDIGSLTDGWDITPLHTLGGFEGSYDYDRDSFGQNASQGTGWGIQSVVVEINGIPSAHHASVVNYALWGLAHRLCAESCYTDSSLGNLIQRRKYLNHAELKVILWKEYVNRYIVNPIYGDILEYESYLYESLLWTRIGFYGGVFLEGDFGRIISMRGLEIDDENIAINTAYSWKLLDLSHRR